MRGTFTMLAFFALAAPCFGQDVSNFTQFFINPYTLNPSYAGVEGRMALFVGFREQWSSINGAPVIGNFSLHTPLKKAVNFGLMFASDKRGITQVSSGLVTIGYTATIDNNTALRFGLSAGYGYNSVDFSNVGNLNDPALANLMSKNSFLIGNAGVSIHRKTFHAGIAMPNLFQSIYMSKDAFTVTALKPFQAVVIHASNRFYFNNDQNVFEPYLIYRLNGPLPSQVEAAAVVHLQHMVWVGASYKQQFGLSGLFGFKLQNEFAVGFSYSIQNSGANQIPSPSYELQLGYLVGKKKKDVAAYSFVNTQKEKVHRKTAAEIAADRKKQQQILDKRLADDRKKKEDQLAKQKEAKNAQAANVQTTVPPNTVVPSNATQKNPTQNNVAQNNAPNNVPAQEAKVPVQPQQTEVKKDTARGGPRMKAHADPLSSQPNLAVDQQHQEEQEKLQRLEAHAADPDELHNNEVVHPHAERHEFVKKGGHHEELDYGTYVIAGVFRSRANAENFSTGLNKMSFTSDFGFLTEKNLWYVYVAQTDDIKEAQGERDKYRKMKIFRDSWLLTVHK